MLIKNCSIELFNKDQMYNGARPPNPLKGTTCKMNLRRMILNNATRNADEVIATQRRCYETQKPVS
jgi:hypothetical protein